MKAARIVKLNEPLQVQELQTPTPKGTQVLVKIQSSGLCHSDVHVWEGYYAGIGANIIAMDLDDNKLDVAKKNGADNTINSKKEDPVKAIMELTDNMGADAVIDFVNASKTVETDMQLLRRRAKVVLVGLFGGELKLNLVTMPTRAYKIIGSYTGSISEMVELVSLAKRGVIKPVISERFKLEQATEALSKLNEGKITGRGVINP